jgi:hypothetical protein
MSLYAAKQFMRTPYKTTLFLAVGVLCMSVSAPLRAATMIFNNSVNDLTYRFNPGTYEVGDEIRLAGSERYLTYFSFEYWGVNTTHPTYFDGTIQARVQFYQNIGAPYHGYATPSPTSFFDSGWFSVASPTARRTFEFTEESDFSPGGLYIPTSDMTWSVEFQGMTLADSVGVDIYSPPTAGSDYPDYWQNNGGWTLLTNVVPMDFAARFQANSTVPEPSTLALSLVGGLGILTLARRMRCKE